MAKAGTTTSASATSAAKSKPLSLFDDLVGSGYPDDVDATVKSAYFAPWKYPGAKGYKCYLLIDFVPDPESGENPFTYPYQCNWLNKLQPSDDSESPKGGTIDEYIALGDGASIAKGDEELYRADWFVGGKIGQKSDAAFFFEYLLHKIGFEGVVTGSISETLNGKRFHLNQIESPYQKKEEDAAAAGAEEGKKKSAWKVLVPTKLLTDARPTASKSAAKTKANGADEEQATDEDEAESESFSDRLEIFIVQQLKASEGPMAAAALKGAAMRHFDGSEASDVVELLRDKKFLAAGPWKYNAADKELSLT